MFVNMSRDAKLVFCLGTSLENWYRVTGEDVDGLLSMGKMQSKGWMLLLAVVNLVNPFINYWFIILTGIGQIMFLIISEFFALLVTLICMLMFEVNSPKFIVERSFI